MSKELLQDIIKDFSPEKFPRFFREKNRSFAPRTENLIQYDDAHFRNGIKLGEVQFAQDEKMLICAFEANQPLSERSGKKAQYEKGKKILKESQSDAGIFVFYNPQGNFRFSLIYANYLGKTRDWSAFRRFTYFVSPSETNKTFLRQIGEGDFSSLEKIKGAFSVEKVTKEFYAEIANWYFWTMDKAQFPKDFKYSADPQKDDELRNAINLIRLITRIIFIWFIRQKGIIPDALFDKNLQKSIVKDFCRDNKSANYYNAILQNLFFGTLNQKMDERGFAKEGSFHKNINEYGVKNLFRYADKFTINEDEVIGLFKDIPFLNGGLFDCLDKPDEQGKTIYVDGFSRNTSKQAKIPDYLFFQENEISVDLSSLGLGRNQKVKGLFEILNNYNFTIDENTPVDLEIALDPELLGKVFENLLASYNPETQTTARKQTGSFYTPREIVNYMVDESLIAYLSSKLPSPLAGEGKGEGDNESRLRRLLSYTDEPHQFAPAEVDALINAIDNAKILDPACGSGAFPMGILHKLVHILHKLDPKNEQWKKRQIEKAKLIDDPNIRQNAINDIEAAFESNELDYGRKLYLIENSIYGVDIQSIAVQIAKLRFFISLIIDEKKQPGRENLGIRSLPNLETKFVAANTLIGLDKPQGQQSLRNLGIERLEKELKQLRHEYFNAKTRKEKLQCQKQDKKLRLDIAALLVKDGWNDTTAKQIVKFDPYDQNASADFFDPEWMFGIKNPSPLVGEGTGEGGFDVVIGNPPYFNVSTINKELFNYLSGHYPAIHTGYNDIVYYFIYLGIELLKNTGGCALITSNYYLGNEYAKKLRSYLKAHASKIVNFKDHMVFEGASIHTCISISQKKAKSDEITFFEPTADEQISSSDIESALRSFTIKRADLNDNWIIADQSASSIINKLNKATVLLGDTSTIKKGATSGDREIFTIRKSVAEENRFENELLKTSINSKDIKRYLLVDSGEYLIYVDNNTNIKKYPNIYKYLLTHQKTLSKRNEVVNGLYPWYRLERPREKEVFNANEKIVVPYRAENNMFAYDNKQGFNDGGGSYAIVMKDDKINIKYVLALLNSKPIDWFYGFIGKPKGKVREYFNKPLSLIPIKKIPLADQQPFITLVDQILTAKQKNPDADTSAIERQIDKMVYALYGLTPEEIAIVEGKG